MPAERLGFDAVFLSEHHFTAYNLLHPNLMVAALASHTFLFQDAALPPDPALLPDSYAFQREIFGRFMEAPDTFEDILGAGIVLCGSAETVREQLLAQVEPLGLQQVCLLFAFGNLPHEKVVRSTELFAEHVLPALRP